MNSTILSDDSATVVGHIQSFGYLLGLDAASKTIKIFSANFHEIFPIEDRCFGRSLGDFPELFQEIIESDIYINIDFNTRKNSDVFLNKINIKGEDFHFSCYRNGDIIFLEFEKIVMKFLTKNYVSKRYESIHNAKNAEEIWKELLYSVDEAVDFDHVIIYKFQEDGSGVVIAEKVKPSVESILNLHYPASVFPNEAKSQYLLKRKRIYSNLHENIIPVLSPSWVDVNYNLSSCRVMGTAHAASLTHMGISSAFSTSIVINNQLWGVVVCLNKLPKHIDLINRVRAEIFTIIAVNAYTSNESRELLESNIEFNKRNVHLKKKFFKFDSLEESLLKNINDVRKYPLADGLAIVIKDKIVTSGLVPTDEEIFKIANWAKTNFITNLYADHEFNVKQKHLLGDIPFAAGVIFEFPDDQRNQLLMWFRKPDQSEIKWGWDPKIDFHDAAIDQVSNGALGNFTEVITGKSIPWQKKDILAAKNISSIIMETSHNQFIKVKELNHELQILNEELSSFSYTISHDLGTLLTVMKLNAQMLKRIEPENAKVQQKVNSILEEIDGMEMMMRSVLNLSRAKTAEIALETLETRAVIEKVCYDVQLTLECKNTVFKFGSFPTVLADRTMLTQIFQNVIGNAVKYSSKSKDPVIEISGEKNGNNIVYKIKDNGIGIAPEEHDKMFKIFNRMDNAKCFQGNGVGMSIVYRIMKRLGGYIKFESVQNEGTTFSVGFQKP